MAKSKSNKKRLYLSDDEMQQIISSLDETGLASSAVRNKIALQLAKTPSLASETEDNTQASFSKVVGELRELAYQNFLTLGAEALSPTELTNAKLHMITNNIFTHYSEAELELELFGGEL